MKEPHSIIVYTAITRNYDLLFGPGVIDSEFDYVCFHDRSRLLQLSNSTNWELMPFKNRNLDPVRRNREAKLRPHNIFSDYEYSVYIDGNIEIIGDIRELLRDYDYPSMLAFRHPLRDCIYDEARSCIRAKKDSPEVIDRQIAQYLNEGHPPHFGLIEANVLIRRHGDPLVRKVMEEWWQEVASRSRRDQISFPYVARRNNFWPTIMGADHAHGASPYFRIREASPHSTRLDRLRAKSKQLFDSYVAWRFK